MVPFKQSRADLTHSDSEQPTWSLASTADIHTRSDVSLGNSAESSDKMQSPVNYQ